MELKKLVPVFQLVLTLSFLVSMVFFAVKGVLIGSFAMLLGTLITGYIIVIVDWPLFWKPLLEKMFSFLKSKF